MEQDTSAASSAADFSWTGRKGLWYAMAAAQMDAQGEMKAEAAIAADSPWFCGHFPDNPILPAIAQLDLIVALVSICLKQSLYIKALNRVKFKQPVLPGAVLSLWAKAANKPNSYQFIISKETEEVCLGLLFLAPHE